MKNTKKEEKPISAHDINVDLKDFELRGMEILVQIIDVLKRQEEQISKLFKFLNGVGHGLSSMRNEIKGFSDNLSSIISVKGALEYFDKRIANIEGEIAIIINKPTRDVSIGQDLINIETSVAEQYTNIIEKENEALAMLNAMEKIKKERAIIPTPLLVESTVKEYNRKNDSIIISKKEDKPAGIPIMLIDLSNKQQPSISNLIIAKD
jgi:hypothetical protein